MKRLMMGVATAALVVTTAHAQAPFADVPRDHWAYDAVNTLAQRGLIIGYPDGTFGGKRAMTRYEFAVVIARMLPQLEENIRSEVTRQIDARPDTPVTPPTVTPKDPDLSGYVTKSDFDALRRLVDQFAPELQMLQVDVANIRRDLDDLRDRVGAVEKAVERIQISGEATIVSRHSAINGDDLRSEAGSSINLVDTNGRPLVRTNNLLEWSQILYNLNLGISAKVNDKVKANTLLSIGNYNSFATSRGIADPVSGLTYHAFPYGVNSRGAVNADIAPLKAYIEAPVSLGPLGTIALEAGKTGVQFTPYSLKLVDYDDYTSLTHTDNGEVIFTGLKGNFNVGGVGVTAYAGTHGNSLLRGGQSATGAFVNQSGYPVLFTGGTTSPQLPYAFTDGGMQIATVPQALFGDLPAWFFPATQSAGVHATLGTPFNGTLGLTYINAGLNDGYALPAPNSPLDDVTADRAQVYGADLSLNLFRGIGLALEYSNSNVYERGSKITLGTNDSIYPREYNEAYDAKLSFGIRNLAFTAGYKRVEPFFGAPGAWGSIGSWKNPTNIEGFNGSIGIPLGSNLAFSASGAQYESIVAGTGMSPLTESDETEITNWKAGLKFRLTSANSVDLGVESVYYKPNWTNDKAREIYYNLGFGSDISENTSFKLLYQIIDYRDKGTDLLNGGNDAKGSVAVGQFSVKF